MTRLVPVLPPDTAWRRFRRFEGQEVLTLTEAVREALARNAPAFNLDPAVPALAAELTAFAPHLPEDERLALLLLTCTVLADRQQGSTRTPIDGSYLGARFRALMRGALPPADHLVGRLLAKVPGLLAEGALPEVIGHPPHADRPLLVRDGWLMTERLYRLEGTLAERLLASTAPIQGRPPRQVVQQALADVLARPVMRGGQPVVLSEEQQAAVLTAAGRRLTLVTGGPGTGKTSVVVALLRTLVRLGLKPEEIALAAPTGKAAWRMGEALTQGLAQVAAPAEPDQRLSAALPTPRTLHRLLGYSPATDRFRHHQKSPLPEKVVVVDEASMIDLFLMERLVSAVDPAACLVLLGDADQLPSVDAGTAYRDALASPKLADAKVQLQISYRMRGDDPEGAAVLALAGCINRGDEAALGADWQSGPFVERASAAALRFSGVERLSLAKPGADADFARRWFEAKVAGDSAHRQRILATHTLRPEGKDALDRLFAHAGASRLLCLTHGFDTGAVQHNETQHRLFAREYGVDPQRTYIAGEPVMMLQNDYDHQLFNGDQGLVLWVEGVGERPAVVFPGLEGGYRAFPLELLQSRLTLCHAMTVHKSQGSEFDAVAVLLPETELPLLNRALLYTAVTRAKKSVVLVGAREILVRGALQVGERFSGLSARLSER